MNPSEIKEVGNVHWFLHLEKKIRVVHKLKRLYKTKSFPIKCNFYIHIVKVIGCNTAIMEESFPETASCSEGA